MSLEDCIEKGKALLSEAEEENDAKVALRASYYFFWGEDFESAKKALETAYLLGKDTYLPRNMAPLLEPKVRSALVHSFDAGMEEILVMPPSRLKEGKLDSVLRQGGLGDNMRKLVQDYIGFETVVFMRAYLLSLRA